MRRYKLIGAALCAGVLALWGGRADAEEFSARLDGFQELGSLPNVTQNSSTLVVTAANPTGAVLSRGTGTLELNLEGGMIHYKLIYSDVGITPPQTGMVSQAHIHFGKSRDSGGVMVFFCTNLGNGPEGTQLCPAHDATLRGTFTAASVVGPAAQNVSPGNFDALVAAITSNTAYANIHTVPVPPATNTAYPAGEIRGQIHKGDLDEKRDHHDDDHHDHHEHR